MEEKGSDHCPHIFFPLGNEVQLRAVNPLWLWPQTEPINKQPEKWALLKSSHQIRMQQAFYFGSL